MRYEPSVCYGCPLRTATCHATCPDGIREAQQNAARREENRRRSAGAYGLFDSYLVNRAVRTRISKDRGHK